MSSPIFESERIAFYDWSNPEHVSAMVAINQDEEVMEFFPSTLSEDETLDFVKRNQALFVEKGYCYFACVEKSTRDMIGFIGIYDQNYESEYTPATDIGWRLKPTAQGRGLATEGAMRCLQYAFDDLKFRHIIVIAPEINTPSIAVMERLKMDYLGSFDHPKLASDERLKKCKCYQILKNHL